MLFEVEMLLLLSLIGFALAGIAMPTAPEETETETPPDQTDMVVNGGPLNDLLSTLAGDDYLAGHLGDDILKGGDGADTLIGGMGDDTLVGGDGDDTLHGYYDNDLLIGGQGSDLIFGGNGNDILDGREPDPQKDFLNGGAGDDWIVAGAGDHVNSGSGSDTIALLSEYDAPVVVDDMTDEDTIIIGYPAQSAQPALSAEADSGGIMIFGDGKPLVYLQGATNFDLGAIRFEAL
ncbi:calcium-binding protein [Marivivens sp. LCG002]|uniref:calcium-binding protein n=1 Tax=Marivivens sp. LCG002 TaxID=3051171 RepID=UPI002557ADA9|nr:calcium-binding protein [Marivivens sp. LCG002]WIV50628.1 calcium-binding protein [Marivivens sp. LCG002]